MATTFESSLSSSLSSRPTMSSMAPSMADQLPSINFGFDELRDRMAKFTMKFDTFIELGRKRVLEEHNQFRMNLTELQEDQRMKKKDIEIVQHKIGTHQQMRSKEDAERREMEGAIGSLTAQRDANLAARDELRRQIAEAEREVEARLAAQRAHAAQVEAQSRFNVPELDFWVTNLCLRIEGAGQNDRLKFVYTHVDERDWEREAWFELNTAARDYDIRHCRPKIERDKIDRVLERVNESRELPALLKGMRELFVEAMKS
ncbi:putative kinetochore protein spc25 [Rosellinia necatrix]|uniref:Kinetochore protein SPC25 n=1 Tax=Rosellinia necatrix TaxID=77044 RepID=A0A1W2TL28_ROSNE|nr:putative kinetochore protein spc25 [Rosellinia necatrix]